MTRTATSHEVTVEVSVRVGYKVTLTNKAAKTICEEFLDPDESWASQAELTLQSAFESFEVGDAIIEKIADSMPTEIKAEPQGIAFTLRIEDSAEVEIDSVEVA